MYTPKSLLIVLLVFLNLQFVRGQNNNIKQLTLQEVIEIAKNQSPDALSAKHRFRSNYWEYRTYKAGFMPMLDLEGTLPELSRSIDRITVGGQESFVEREFMSSSLNMSLSKNIGLTGGQIFVNSELQRIDLFQDSTITSYLTTPLNIGFRQPLFAHNEFKWDKKIEPLKYKEAKRNYLENMESVAITATNYFFDLLLAQINLKIARVNQANNDTLYKIAQGRYNLGTIAENELLQLELSLLNANAQLEQAELNMEMKLFDLKSYLRVKEDIDIKLIPPNKTYDIQVEVNKAITEAYDNRADALSFERKLLEARSNVNRAKRENRFNADLYAVYGLNRTADEFFEAYQDPRDQQRLMVGFQIPILDWGLAKGKIKMAESNQELVKTSVEQQKIDFDQEIFLKVRQFNMQENQLQIAAKSDTVARKRYNVTKQRYLIGKIDITDLNIAQTEKDNARQGYISTLRDYWINYLQLRRLTLYDYRQSKPLEFDIEEVL
ncbi:MAG: TolC family protein [Bacteroidales bacterium]|nr:TolC family protein [Bacteroidales bacterium]